jgi:hypothetical protein
LFRYRRDFDWRNRDGRDDDVSRRLLNDSFVRKDERGAAFAEDCAQLPQATGGRGVDNNFRSRYSQRTLTRRRNGDLWRLDGGNSGAW